MKLGKRQFIIAALVVALGAAVYLNWQFSANDSLLANADESSKTSSSKEIGEAKYVNTSASKKSESSKSETTSNESVKETNAKADEKSEYFAQAELKRKQVQDEELELLNNIIEDNDKNEAAKTEAVKQVTEITKRIEQQSNIESLIKAKGFDECIAFISNGECNIVVSAGNVTNAGAITIKDIVHKQSGIEYDKITITEQISDNQQTSSEKSE